MNAFAPSPLAFADAVAAANQWVDDATDLIAQYHRLARDRDMWTERAAGATGNRRWWCVNMAGILTDTMLLVKDAIESVRDDTLSGLYLTAHHVPASLIEAADDFNDRLSDDCISLNDALARDLSALAGNGTTKVRDEGPLPEARVSLIARAVRQSLRSYGHRIAESSLPECIASDVEAALRTMRNDTSVPA